MATWAEVKAALGRQFSLDSEQADQLTLTLPLKDGGARRAQRVMVQHLTAWEQPILEFRSAFGEVRPGEADAWLAGNLDLPIGAVAQHGRYLVLVQRLPLAGCSVDGVVWTLGRVAELADVLEERRGGDRF